MACDCGNAIALRLSQAGTLSTGHPGTFGIYNQFVRRLLIVLLLAWLPVQSVWAALSVYCGHESAPATRTHETGGHEAAGDADAPQSHAGHHEHQHDDDAHPPGAGGTAHPDCAVCHAAAALPARDLAAGATHAHGALPPFAVISLPAPPARAPDRPNWRFA